MLSPLSRRVVAPHKPPAAPPAKSSRLLIEFINRHRCSTPFLQAEAFWVTRKFDLQLLDLILACWAAF
jgi:hypothetical protein